MALTLAALWFGLFIILCAYAHDFMATPIVDGFTVAYALGLSQFVLVWIVTGVYLRSSTRVFVPLQEEALAYAGTSGAVEVHP